MKFSPRLEEYRLRMGDFASNPGDPFGAFLMPGPCGQALTIVATDGLDTGWEHVSVSKDRHPPNWQEMCFIKDLFWSPEECVVQFHPRKSSYVNNHSRCLHLWRWTRGDFPVPPQILIGVKELGTLT